MLNLPQIPQPIEFNSLTSINTRDESQDIGFLRLKSDALDFHLLTNEMKNLDRNLKGYWYALGSRLKNIYDHHLFHGVGYRSFSEYCNRNLGYSRQHAYKLIMIVKFIDDRWEQAKTSEQRGMVERLFSLGFTKLYYLHYKSSTEIDEILCNGLPTTNIGISGLMRRIHLENATIKHFRQNQHRTVNSLQDDKTSSSDFLNLITVTQLQAKSLLKFIDQWLNNVNNQELVMEQLQTMRQYAVVVAESMDMLVRNQETTFSPVNLTSYTSQ